MPVIRSIPPPARMVGRPGGSATGRFPLRVVRLVYPRRQIPVPAYGMVDGLRWTARPMKAESTSFLQGQAGNRVALRAPSVGSPSQGRTAVHRSKVTHVPWSPREHLAARAACLLRLPVRHRKGDASMWDNHRADELRREAKKARGRGGESKGAQAAMGFMFVLAIGALVRLCAIPPAG